MGELSHLMQADTERLFADWGEAALFQEVTRQFDVTAGAMRELSYSRRLNVIRGEDRPQLAGDVSATLSLTRRLVLVRACDLPTGAIVESARMILEETPYEIRSVRESNQAGVMVLECLRQSVQES